jgi:hypothetical protein
MAGSQWCVVGLPLALPASFCRAKEDLMRAHIVVSAAILLFLAGCVGMEAGGGKSAFAPFPPPDMDHHVGTSHIELFWRCLRPEAGRLWLEGMAINRYSPQPVQFFTAELVGVDAAGRIRAAGRGEARDVVIRTYEGSPFRIMLAETGDEKRYDLYYQYQHDEIELHGRLASAAGAAPWALAATQHFLARDACNPAQHRIR